MKQLIAIACVCLGSVLLASCGKPVHSVDYYKQHEDERKAMLEKCTADPDLVTRDEIRELPQWRRRAGALWQLHARQAAEMVNL